MFSLQGFQSNSRNVYSAIIPKKIHQDQKNFSKFICFLLLFNQSSFKGKYLLCKIQQILINFNSGQPPSQINFFYNRNFKKNYILKLFVQVLFKSFKIMVISYFFISMDQFSLVGEWDKIRYIEQSESANIYGNFVQDSSNPYVSFGSEKSENQTIQHLLSINVLSGYELTNQISNQQLFKKQNQRLSQSYQQISANLFAQSIIDKGGNRSITDLSCSSSEESQKKQKKRNNPSQNKKIRNRKRIKKQDKNQYDKNIPGHIVSTVVNQILKPTYKQELQFYCKKLQTLSQNQHVTYQNIIRFATNVKERSKKFGTSQLGHFFCDKNLKSDLQKVFGLFMVRFLKQQYILHILSVGKMSNKQKYLECATNMMYIPKLRQEEYSLIHQFYRKDV